MDGNCRTRTMVGSITNAGGPSTPQIPYSLKKKSQSIEKIWLALLACTAKTDSEVTPKSKISIIFYNRRNEKCR